MKIIVTPDGFVGALDVVGVKVLLARFGLGHESSRGASLKDLWDLRDLRRNEVRLELKKGESFKGREGWIWEKGVKMVKCWGVSERKP